MLCQVCFGALHGVQCNVIMHITMAHAMAMQRGENADLQKRILGMFGVLWAVTHGWCHQQMNSVRPCYCGCLELCSAGAAGVCATMCVTRCTNSQYPTFHSKTGVAFFEHVMLHRSGTADAA
jgi:hypothetical protein